MNEILDPFVLNFLEEIVLDEEDSDIPPEESLVEDVADLGKQSGARGVSGRPNLQSVGVCLELSMHWVLF